MADDSLKRRLRWQCRRGLGEIEGVLNTYLEQHFDHESTNHQALFETLLACQDADMLDWFLRRSRPDNEPLRSYVDHVLNTVAPSHTPS